MKTDVLTTAERFRRYQRDLRAYRQRSLWRRSHKRFRRDLVVLPHLFLAQGQVQAADPCEPRDDVIKALRGQAVWTLDTAARLTCGFGFLTTQDLTGYMSHATFEWAARKGLIQPKKPSSISVTPTWSRPAMLIAHLTTESPPSTALDSGDLVVGWDRLMADVKGTIGWRPDVLTRLEDSYLQVVPRNLTHAR